MVGHCFTAFSPACIHWKSRQGWKRILSQIAENTEWFQLQGIDPESSKADQSQIESTQHSLRPQEMFPCPDATAPIGRTNVIVCKHPESYLSSNSVALVSFALLVLSATPKHPFRQTTPPCSRAPCSKWKVNSLKAKMQSNRHEFVESQSAPVLEVLQAEMIVFVELQRLPTTTIEHEAMDCDKSHRGCCTRGSRSHQSQISSTTVLLGCHAGLWCRIP